MWAGDSPYEVVLWLPYVSCYGTKSMYFCDATRDANVQDRLAELRQQTSEDLYDLIKADAPFVEMHACSVLTAALERAAVQLVLPVGLDVRDERWKKRHGGPMPHRW